MAERPLPAYEGDDPYVFVSHSHDDRPVVYAEIRWLQDQGIRVWYDTGISVGSEWSEALARAIKGASHFIYFVTPRSVASENCRRELNFALEEQGSILAVHLEPTDVPDGIRLNLNNRQALFRDTDSNYRQNLLEVLSVKPSNGSIESTRHLAAPRVPVTRRPLAITFAISTLLFVAGVIWWYFRPPFDAGGDSSEQIRSLAVLPLENLSGDPDQEYIADGMTAALIDELGRLESLEVISRLSVMRYKHSEKSLQEIASALGVRALVGGTVLKEGGKFRVTVELIDAETDTQIWNDRFDTELSGVLELHANVARAVAEQIRLELTPREEILLAASRPVDPEAYEAYQKGLYLQNYVERGGDPYRESLLRSIEYQKEAIKQDPGWALAYAALARTYHFLGGGENGAKFFALSKAASLKALELDDSLAKAHESLAYVLANYEWDWEGAAKEYQRALDLDPNSVDYWGYSILLWAIGPDEAAIAGFERAEEQSPDSLEVKTQLGMVYTCASQHDEAVEQLQKVIELNPEYAGAHIALGRAHMGQSMYAEAVAEMEIAIELCDETTCLNTLLSPWPTLGEAYARAGRTADALEVLRELEATERAYYPGLYAALDQKDNALAHLEAGAEKRVSDTIFLRCSWFDSLRDAPRFQDLVRRMNFP